MITLSVIQKIFVRQVVFLWNNSSQFNLTEVNFFQNLFRYKCSLKHFVKIPSFHIASRTSKELQETVRIKLLCL